MAFNTAADQIVYPNDAGGLLVEIPDGPTIDNIFYFAINGKTMRRVRTGPVRAQECGILPGSDMTTRLQTVLDNANVKTLVFDFIAATDITINGAVTVPTGKTLKFYDGNRITGSGSVSGGIIDAGDLTECFSATFACSPANSTKNYYSARWFGAKGDGIAFDNVAIQKIWDFIAANQSRAKPIYFPAGNYLHDNGTLVYRWTGTAYAQVMIKIVGEMNCRSGANSTAMTRFTCTSNTNMNDKFILGIQLGREVEISNIQFIGKYTIVGPNSPFSLLQVITNPESAWTQSGISDQPCAPHCCLNIDPFGATTPVTGTGYLTGGWSTFYRGNSSGGTSQVIIRGCRFENTVVGFACSINSRTFNAEMVSVHESSFAYLKVCAAYGQAQTKENLFNDNRIWERCRTIIDCSGYGSGEGAPPYVNGMNIAGACFQLIRTTAPFEFHGRDIYAETLGRIGIMESSTIQHTIQDSVFHFATGAGLFPSMDFIVSGRTSFDGVQLQYYDGGFQRLKLTKPNNLITMRGGALTRMPMTSSVASAENLKLVQLDSVVPYGETSEIYNDTANQITWNLLKNTPMFGQTVKGVSAAGSDGSIAFEYNETKYDQHALLETVSVTKALDGTCSMTLSAASLEKIRVNDMLISDVSVAWKYWEDAVTNDPMPVLGRIIAIDTGSGLVTLQGAAINVPNTTTANVPVYVNYIRHFNAPIVGDLTSGSKQITNVEFMFGFTPNVGIRLEHPFIPTGAYVTAVGATTIDISVAASGTQTDASIINGRPNVTLYLRNAPAISGIKGYLIEGAFIQITRTGASGTEGDRHYVNKSILSTGSSRTPSYLPMMGGVMRVTIEKLKTIGGPSDANTTYFITDEGKQGSYILDASDTTTANNNATVIVATGSARFKRIIPTNFYDARWFNKSTRAFSTTAEAVSLIGSAYRFIGLTVMVETAGSIDEYWWKAGILDGDLVIK